MPLTRPLFQLASAALVFVAGWTAARIAPHATPLSAGAPAAAAEPATCADPLAMAANATLVGDVREVRHDLDLANERLQANARPAEAAPGRLQSAPEDWARRASDETIVLRIPCARWDGAQSLTVHGPRRQTHMRRSNDASRRADFLGLGDGERELLAQAYARTQSRVWQSIRQACESEPEYRKAVAEQEDLEDGRRIAECRGLLVSATDPSTRGAYREVVAIRASGRNDRGDRLDGRARVLFALTGAGEVLFDEMRRALGVDLAARLVDHGVTCFDESAYDLRRSEPEG